MAELAGDRPGAKTTVEKLMGHFEALKGPRGQFDQHWQDLAEVMLPRRADFTRERTVGERRTEEIYDGTPMMARRSLSSAIDGLLKPKTSKWFKGKMRNEQLNEIDEVKEWLDIVNDRLYQAIYAREARFVQRSGEVDNDLVTFGTGVMFIGERSDLRHLLFQAYGLKDTYLGQNADAEVDQVFIRIMYTPAQAAARWGEENLGRETREALKKGGKDAYGKQSTYVWAVLPREKRDPRRLDNLNMPFSSHVVDVRSKHLVSEGGFQEFPFATPRWDTATGEVYGRSPGMIALPDSLTAQQMGKTILQAGHRAVDPPIWQFDDSVIGPLQTFPGGVTNLDGEAAERYGRVPLGTLDTGFNFPLGREMQQDTRDQIWQAFFRNVLNLPTEGPQMTAFEVAQRKEEFVRTIGPVFGQLETDYLAATVERSFNILDRAGAFPPPPDAIDGEEMEFAYASPVEQVRKQIEAAGAAQSINLLAPFVEADPTIMDNFDGDEIARDTPEIYGMPQKWLRSEDEVAALRQQRDQQETLAALPEAAEKGTKAVKNLADAEAAVSSE